MSKEKKAPKLRLVKDRRARARTAPGYPSRRGQPLVEGLTKTELVVKYAQQVRLVAQKIGRDLPHSIELDDLVGMGFIGLMDAADRYDSSHGAAFRTYAEFRIRGAIIDSLRQQDWVPRSVRDRVKEMERAKTAAEHGKGATPTDEEVSKAMGLRRDEYQKLQTEIGGLSLVTLGDETEFPADASTTPETPKFEDPFTETARKITQEYLDQLFRKLSENERLVMNCYYYRGLNLREISRILGVTESRVSQIHAQAIHKLKDKLKQEFPDTHEMFATLLAAA